MSNSWKLEPFSLFRDLPDRSRDMLGGIAMTRMVGKGVSLFSPGEPSTSMFGVIEGRVRVWSVSGAGTEITLNFIGPGELVGEIGVLDGGPRTAGASAIEETRLLVIRRDAFFRAIEAEPALALRIIGLLCQRLRWVTARMEDSALRSAPERLARMLEHLRREYGRPSAGGTEIGVRLSQGELARWTQMSREGLNKILARWSEAGLLTSKGGILVLHDNGRLAEIAEGDDIGA